MKFSIFSQTKRGANGKFLPKTPPFFFHLRHNSKTNQPKFWQILSFPKSKKHFISVEVGGVEPPCKRENLQDLRCVDYLFKFEAKLFTVLQNSFQTIPPQIIEVDIVLSVFKITLLAS